MQRDDDFLRELLFKIEEAKHGLGCPPIMGATDEELKKLHHLRLLCDQGYISEEHAHVFRLTSAGHDHINAVRDPGTWEKTKEQIAKLQEPITLTIIKDIATKLLNGGS